MKLGIYGILAALMTISIGHGVASADVPGNHPAYLHTRSDLRAADALLNNERYVSRDTQAADYEIDIALREVRRAARIVGKDIDDRPPIDVSLYRNGRLREVLRLLEGARQDLDQDEDNFYAREWRNSSLYHVNRAIYFVQKAIDNAGYDRPRRY